MFRHILVPLDGSSRAEQALPVAAQVARVTGGTVTLLQVVTAVYKIPFYGLDASYIPPDIIESNLARARDYLDGLRQHGDLAGVTIQTQAVLGDPASVITDDAAKQPTDLIILSSHGYTGVKRWILGSIAEKVARHSSVPVLILRVGEPLRIHRGTSAVRALVPLDTSARARDAIMPAANLVAALSAPGQGELHLTRLVVTSEEVQGAEQHLATTGQRIQDELRAGADPALHLALNWSVFLASDIAEGIVSVAEQGEKNGAPGKIAEYDFIALTTHGVSGIQRWTLGTVIERVLHSTRLPVLVVRPADMRSKEHR